MSEWIGISINFKLICRCKQVLFNFKELISITTRIISLNDKNVYLYVSYVRTFRTNYSEPTDQFTNMSICWHSLCTREVFELSLTIKYGLALQKVYILINILILLNIWKESQKRVIKLKRKKYLIYNLTEFLIKILGRRREKSLSYTVLYSFIQ